ncbi:MAG: 3'-5' exonuclease [Verrucomicrobia bacterium]|jgi:DNA polymerase III subunit alpha, Gram-positive type|nr:3'-5' exonuclease [Verrucomicrobiota bacterium]MBT7066676.1 3'-5' exonuclease [Verrucomicrobiota bacterium]MBT7700375.1 3'-5' exonuclease [Verrucomicrobiota bacterium]
MARQQTRHSRLSLTWKLGVGCWVLGVHLLLVGLPASAGPIPKGLRATTFVAFDVETTGLSAARHRVIEIGAVKLRAGRIMARQVWLINPGQPIPPFTTRIHGIKDEDVAEAPTFPEIYPKFVAFVKGTILIAHNAAFDVRFMAHEAERHHLEFPPEPVLDNLRLARKWHPELKSHGLKAVADYLKIEPGRYHRALDDSEALAKVFIDGLRRMPPDSTVSNLLVTAGDALYIKPAVTLNSTPTKPTR